jgi:hypothetical protein
MWLIGLTLAIGGGSMSISEQDACNTNDCEWSSWEIGGRCSRKCGTGQQLLTRRCNGKACDGDNTKMDDCNTQLCDWENWTVSQWPEMRPDTELTTANIIKRSYIDKEEAKKAYCPKCNSRKYGYQLKYSRKCLGPECSTTEKTFADFEEVIIRCESLEPCGMFVICTYYI